MGWSEWTEECRCQADSTGKAFKERECKASDGSDSDVCEGESENYEESCDTVCPEWGPWDEWSECTIKCKVEDTDTGSQHRQRPCQFTNGSILYEDDGIHYRYDDPLYILTCPLEDSSEQKDCENVPACSFDFDSEEEALVYVDFKLAIAEPWSPDLEDSSSETFKETAARYKTYYSAQFNDHTGDDNHDAHFVGITVVSFTLINTDPTADIPASALKVASNSSSRRRRKRDARDSINDLAAIAAQFEVIYGVDNHGKDKPGTESRKTKLAIQDAILAKIAATDEVDPASSDWNGNQINVLKKPKKSDLYSRYTDKTYWSDWVEGECDCEKEKIHETRECMRTSENAPSCDTLPGWPDKEQYVKDCSDEQKEACKPTTPRPATTTTTVKITTPTTVPTTTKAPPTTTTTTTTTTDPSCDYSDWSECSKACILPGETSKKTRTKTCGDVVTEEEAVCTVDYCTCEDKPGFCSGPNEQCFEHKENGSKSLHCKCMHPYQKDENGECKKCIALRPFSHQCYGLEDGLPAGASRIYVSMATVFITLFLTLL